MSEPPKKRRSWLIALPLLLFILLAAAWSGAWFYVHGQAEIAIDRWFAAEAAAGRPHRCPDRAIGGFPFRIELACRAPTFVLMTPTGPAQATLAGLSATAFVYRPNHVLAEFQGPLTLAQGGRDVATITFKAGAASLSVASNVLERMSLELDQVAAARAGAPRPDLEAAHVELHARQAVAPGAAPRDFDVAMTVRGLGPAGITASDGLDLALSGVVRRLPSPDTSDGSGFVAAWARGGGAFELQQLKLVRRSGLAVASGSLGFNSNGRAQGTFQANLVDSSALLGGIAIPGVGDPAMMLGPVLSIVGRPADVEGRRGTRVDIRVENGTLSVGAVQIAEFPPVY